MRTVAIDPGVICPGVAVFNDGELAGARYFRGLGFKGDPNNISVTARELADWARGWGHVDEVVSEWMVPRKHGPKNAHDLGSVWCFTGFVFGLFAHAQLHVFKPDEWKGSKRANPTAAWIINRLKPEERARVEKLSEFQLALVRADSLRKDVTHLTHNTLDAVGIGLKHLGRLEPHMVVDR